MDKPKKKYSKEDVRYQAHTLNYQQKCAKCENKDKNGDQCKILSDKDREISLSGWCTQFQPGKHLIVDKGSEDKLSQRKLEWANEQWQRLQKKRKRYR